MLDLTVRLKQNGHIEFEVTMNKLDRKARAQILGMMVEGMSMLSITRLTGASKNTIAKLLHDAGEAVRPRWWQRARASLQPGRLLRNDQGRRLWQSRRGKGVNVARRAPEPHNAYEHAPVHAADQRI